MYRVINKEVKLRVVDLIDKYQDRDKFIKYCRECPNYDTLWSCPPLTFDANEYLLKYEYSHIICTKIVFDKNTIDTVKDESDVNKITHRSISEVRGMLADKLLNAESLYPDSISIVSGGCNLCDECSRLSNKPCVHPDRMRYSLDTFGFDFTYLLRDLFDVELKWSSKSLPEYFTLVSAFLTNHLLTVDALTATKIE